MPDTLHASDVFSLSTTLIDGTFDFLSLCSDAQTTSEQILAAKDALNTHYVDLVNLPEPELELALKFIFNDCLAKNQHLLWNAIYNKVFFHAQEINTSQGRMALYTIPVHVSVDAAHVGKTFRMTPKQKHDLIQSLFDHTLIEPNVRVRVVSDLIPEEKLPIAPAFYQRLLRTLSNGNIHTCADWVGHGQPQHIHIEREQDAIDEIRYLVLCLQHAEYSFGDIDTIWSNDAPLSDVMDEELATRLDGWVEFVEDQILDEELSAIIWRPEPLNVATHSAKHLLNTQRIEQHLSQYPEDEYELSCQIKLYGEPTVIGDGGIGVLLYLLDKSSGKIVEALPYNRDKNEFFDSDSLADIVDLLHHYDISFQQDELTASRLH